MIPNSFPARFAVPCMVLCVLAALATGCGGGGGGGSTNSGGQTINFQTFSTNNTQNLAVNQAYAWGPVVDNGMLELTDKGQDEASSVYFAIPQNITSFATTFNFQILAGGSGNTSGGQGNVADGFTFVIQSSSLKALGTSGGSLGYEGGTMPSSSLCIKFDTAQNTGDPSYSSTGLFTGGATPVGGVDLLASGIDLRSQHPFQAALNYTSGTLSVKITDLATNASQTNQYAIDIPSTVGVSTAYVGFTGGTGDGTSKQDITSWTWTSGTAASIRRS